MRCQRASTTVAKRYKRPDIASVVPLFGGRAARENASKEQQQQHPALEGNWGGGDGGGGGQDRAGVCNCVFHLEPS